MPPVLVRASLLFTVAGIALALSSAGCSSLTRPNEIQIAAEPAPAPKPAMPAPAAGAAQPNPGAGQPAQGG